MGFTGGCLTQRDDVERVTALGVGHVDDAAVQPAEQVDPLFAVNVAVVLAGNDGVIEDRFATGEVKSVPAQVCLAFRFVSDDHQQIIVTI